MKKIIEIIISKVLQRTERPVPLLISSSSSWRTPARVLPYW